MVEHTIGNDTDEMDVIMRDGQRHHYERSAMLEKLPSGRMASVLRRRGRTNPGPGPI
jgi:hypothetical protein